MQMYKVEFNSRNDSVVQTGTILVCAHNAEAAQDMVTLHCDLVPSQTEIKASRVKPSIYELQRSEYEQSNVDLPAFVTGATPSSHKSHGSVHEITASGKVFAYSEATAIRRLGAAIVDQASASKSQLPKHVNELSVDVQKANERVRQSRIDEQSIYREKRFFSGGAARPR